MDQARVAERELALTRAKGLSPTPANLERLGRELGPELARWAFAQWDLRRRARAKFGGADRMWFVREALEQASHETIAEWHAAQFPSGASVMDLTCGIGGDLMALTRRGLDAAGYELDPERAACAEHNSGVAVRVEDCRHATDPRFALLDPDRRATGRRTVALQELEPNPLDLLAVLQRSERVLIKMSPLTRDDDLARLGERIEFLSFRGECPEACVSLGRGVTAWRGAVRVESGERIESGARPAEADQPGDVVYDVDPAAVRADACGTLAGRLGLQALGDYPGYLTGPATDSEWSRGFAVMHADRWDVKRMNAALGRLALNPTVVKQRGTGIDPISVRKQLRPGGDAECTVILYRVGRSVRAVLTVPLGSSGSGASR